MADIFLKLVNMSFAASFLIVAILILRVVLRRAPRQVICLLWGLVAIRLICPFSIESVLSIIPSVEPIPTEIEYMEMPQIESGVDFIDNTVNPVISENLAPNIGESVNPLQVWLTVGSWLWGLGVVCMLLYACTSYLLLYRRVRASILAEDKIYICDDIDSPFILGIIRPRIYLPSGMDDDTGKYVIAHEKAHLKRLDHLWKPLGFLLLSVYWFNPLMWIGYIMLCRDIELACDEKVIKDMDAEDKKKYSRALISYSASRKIIAACPLAFGEVGAKERVKSVLNYRKPSFWIILVVLLAILGVVLFFMTNPVSEQDAPDTPETSESRESDQQTEVMSEVESEPETEVSYEVLYDKYVEVSQLQTREGVGITDIMFEDRHFICEDSILNELEHLVYNHYYYESAGEYDKVQEAIGQDVSFRLAVQNGKEAFERGDYISDYQIHELKTFSSEDIQNVSDSDKKYLCEYIVEHDLKEYAIVETDISWKHNAASLSQWPQLGDGRYTRYYLLATTEKTEEFKIYNVFWEGFVPSEVGATPTIEQVMDRVLAVVPLEEAIPLTSTADLPPGDQLYFLDATDNGKYSLYGFHSDEYQYTGLLINYKIDGEDNWNYLGDVENWIGYEFPQIAETEDGGLFLTYCYMGGSGVHLDRLLYFKAHETGTLEGYELTYENLLEQAEDLVSFKLDTEKEEVQVYNREGGTKELFAVIPYTYAMNGQDPVIKGVYCESEQVQMKFLLDPVMIIVGVGIYVEDSILPVHIGELAFRVDVEENDAGVEFKLYDVSTYDSVGIKNLPQVKKGINSQSEAVTLVREQLIVAYENVYGAYKPSDTEPGLYSDDASRLAFIIPRLEVREETEEYYVIPVIWDFRVYKSNGEVKVYYNGIDPMEYTFDPTNPNCLAFAG